MAVLARLGALHSIATLLAVLGAFGAIGSVPAAVPPKPNIVVIMTDDQTVEQIRVMASVNALIRDAGATFENSFSSFPLCCPSRATFLTGQYAHNHGVLENETPTGGYYRLKSKNTLPVWLRKAGYRTIHVGKYLNDYGTEDPREVPPGWDEWHGLTDPGTYQMWGYQMNDNGTLTTHGSFEVEDPATYQTDVLARKAVEQIDAAASGTEPFFITLWFLAPHREVASLSNQLAPRPAPRHAGAFAMEPLPKPPSFNEKDMSDKPLFMRVKPRLNASEIATITNQYRAELETLLSVDEAVASVVGALEANGVLGNTYMIFTSDNGYFHGEHRTPDEKILGYENSARVPLVIRGPGIAAGTRVRELVANVDLAPTIAHWAGATPGLAMDGRSLMPFMLDPAKRTRRPVLLEAFWPLGSTLGFFTEQLPASGVVVRPEGVVPAAIPGPLSALPLGKTIMPYEAVRADRYVYFEYATGEHELYDLAVDPWQLSSRHLDPAYLQTQVALALALTKLRLCRGEGCRVQTPVIPNPM